MLRLLTLCMLLGFLNGTPAYAVEPIPVVASFSILANIVREIGGDRVSVDTLVGPEEDAHVFDPAPRDAVRLAAAKLIIINGLGFEGGSIG